MKVAVTFDLSEDEMIALNLMDQGKMTIPKRAEMRVAIEQMVYAQLNAAVPIVREQRDKIRNEIRRTMGVGPSQDES